MKTATQSGQTTNLVNCGRRFPTFMVAGSVAASGLIGLHAVTPSSVLAVESDAACLPDPGPGTLHNALAASCTTITHETDSGPV